MKYTDETRTVVEHDGMSIPVNPMNRDYRKVVQAFLDAGGAIDDPDPAPQPQLSARDRAIEALLAHTATLTSYPRAIREYVER